MWQAEFKLYLYPDDPSLLISRDKLEAVLSSIEFTGKRLGENRYQTGERFLSLLCFMGCSPNIELEPQADKAYCYIEIDTLEKPQFIAGKNTKNAPCPYCKKPLPNPPGKQMNCPACNKPIDITKLNWRKSAFIASSWICIGNIYELEAVPNDDLLNALENETSVKWKPAYIRKVVP